MAYTAISLDDLLTLPDPEWLIEGVAMRQAITMLAGPRGTYKTFYAMDMAMTLARNDVWRFPAAFPDGHYIDRTSLGGGAGKALYIVGESIGAAKFRFTAYEQFHSSGFPSGVRVHPDRVDLFKHPEMVEALVDEEDPDLVIIDTWSRNTYGLGDGIDKTQMDTVLTAIHNIKMGGTRNGRAVVLIHHPNQNRSNSLRGHSALGDDTDIIIRMDPVTGVPEGEHKIHVHNERTKEVDEFKSYTAELFTVFLKDYATGDPLTWPSGTPISSLVIGRQHDFKKSGTAPAGLTGLEKAIAWLSDDPSRLALSQADIASGAEVSKTYAAQAKKALLGSPVTATDSPDGEEEYGE